MIQPHIHRLFGLKSSLKVSSRRSDNQTNDKGAITGRIESFNDESKTKKLYAEFSKGIVTSDVLLNNVIDSVKTN